MKVNRNSWHYRLSHWGGYERTYDNLCTYCQRMFLKTLLVLVAIGLLGVVVHMIATSTQAGALLIMSTFILSLVFIPPATIHYLRKHLDGESPRLPYEGVITNGIFSRGSIIWAYLKAKKQKICPMIEYE